MEKSKTKP